MHYPLTFTEEGGDIVVRSRHFPELLTAADPREEALEHFPIRMHHILLP